MNEEPQAGISQLKHGEYLPKQAVVNKLKEVVDVINEMMKLLEDVDKRITNLEKKKIWVKK